MGVREGVYEKGCAGDAFVERRALGRFGSTPPPHTAASRSRSSRLSLRRGRLLLHTML
jgi:hypothetical protein